MDSKSNETNSSSPLQRFLIGAGTLLVVVLTLIGAILLAMQDSPEEATPVVQISPTMQSSLTPTGVATTPVPVPTFTDTPTPLPPTDTPSATSTPVETTPTSTFTPVPPPPTDTPVPVPPTDTPAPPPVATTAPEEPGVCQKPLSWVDYQVQVGDTLNSLAQRTNTTVFELQQVNCLEPATILPGQIIYLPFTPPTPTPTNTPGPTGTTRPTATHTPTAVAPIVDGMAPSSVSDETAKQDIPVTVFGKNFQARSQGFRAELNGPQFVQLEIVPNAGSTTSFDAIISVPAGGLPLGTYDLVVTNPFLDRAGFKAAAFTVGVPTPTPTVPPPTIIRIIPEEAKLTDLQANDLDLTIFGRNFKPDQANFRVDIRLGGDPPIQLDVISSGTDTNFTARIRAGDVVNTGTYNLYVTNPDNRISTPVDFKLN
jgi:LysM repeat protein